MYKIGTLAKKTGYSPTLLRVWEKRYGFLQPLRGPGGQRLYPEDDLKLLLAIRRELEKGRSIGELAVLGRARLLVSTGLSAAMPAQPVAEQGEHESFIDSIVQAASAMDRVGLTRSLDQAFARLSPDVVVHKVIGPAMERIGDGWQKGQITVAGEHLASSLVEFRLRHLFEASSLPVVPSSLPAPVICACFPGEEHRIGILTVAYNLARRGLPVLYLGSSLPFVDLEEAISQVGAGSVWLSVSSADIFESNRRQLLHLMATFPAVRFFLGGQAVTTEDPELSEAGCRLCLYPCSLPQALTEQIFF